MKRYAQRMHGSGRFGIKTPHHLNNTCGYRGGIRK